MGPDPAVPGAHRRGTPGVARWRCICDSQERAWRVSPRGCPLDHPEGSSNPRAELDHGSKLGSCRGMPLSAAAALAPTRLYNGAGIHIAVPCFAWRTPTEPKLTLGGRRARGPERKAICPDTVCGGPKYRICVAIPAQAATRRPRCLADEASSPSRRLPLRGVLTESSIQAALPRECGSRSALASRFFAGACPEADDPGRAAPNSKPEMGKRLTTRLSSPALIICPAD